MPLNMFKRNPAYIIESNPMSVQATAAGKSALIASIVSVYWPEVSLAAADEASKSYKEPLTFMKSYFASKKYSILNFFL